jgi:hypothetical protein
VATLLCLLLLALISATALASPATSEDNRPEAFYPESTAAVEDAREDAIPVAMPEGDPSVAPGTETEDLGRPEAEDLLQEVFGTAIEASAEVFDELEVEAFRSDHVAVVAAPDPSGDAPAGLLSSSLPLRVADETGNKEVVDLDLEPEQGHLEPENPLAELEIPSQLSEGIYLPESDIEIELAGVSGKRSASTVGDASAFYPNVAHDTDFVVTAAPTGVETYTQLRSVDAPTNQVFELSLPPGHHLQEHAGGAQVVAADGETILSVSPPSALDAAGQRVPSTLKVVDHSVVISVDPPADAVYPILVDPLYQAHTWSHDRIYLEWASHTDPSFSAYENFYGRGGAITISTGSVTPGQGFWNFYVPRYWADGHKGLTPTSYIRNMKLWNLYYETAEPTRTWAHPYMQMGLWSAGKQAFVSYAYRDGLQGPLTDPYWVYDLTNPQEVTDVKQGGYALANNTYYNSAGRYVSVGSTSTEVTDKDLPGFAELGSVPEWLGSAPGSAINYQVSDSGLGIHRVRLVYPSASGGTGETVTSMGCIGNGFNYCRRTVNKQDKELSYNPSLMAQGENTVQVYAVDPVGNQSSAGQSRIKVDRTQPQLSLSGNLSEQAAVGTNLPEYTLNYSASDGDDAAAAAETPIGTPGTGPGQLERPQGVAVDASGNVWVTDRINHRVVGYDKTGKFLRQIGTPGAGDGQINEPRGIAVAPNGNIWVAEAGTNKRIQQFTPTGTFVSKITNGSLLEPWGVAFGPQGEMWVTDQTGRVLVFNSSGTLTKTIANPVLKSSEVPYGVDVDRFGNGWIALQGMHKVIALSPSGSVVEEFGGNGTGPGQFQHPGDIAIAESGNVLVTDDLNHRVQVFKPDGTFLRQFGTFGSGNGQFNGPRGIDVGTGNTAVIADSSNKRVARWSHADQDPQSGAAKVEVKVDGVAAATKAPGCPNKNCVLAGSWVLDADNYAAGAHKVEVIATDAVGLQTTKTIDIETHGDRTNPTLALSGTMTQQASLGTTRPSYGLKVDATDPGPVGERNSGVASMTVKVDGVLVDSAFPGCPAGGCSLSREWTLNSNSYSPGFHFVEVKATDAAGRSSTKTLGINIARDTTPPEFNNLAPFYTAPEGWVEQESYVYRANASDVNGYGVTSILLKIDGEVVNSASQSCPAGGCSKLLVGYGTTLDMSKYAGGAHPAELVATDGAGNTRKRAWTIHVDPSGVISASEATDTMEAVETTAPETTELTPVAGLVTEAPGEEGSNPQLSLDEGELKTEGAAAPSTISVNPENGFAVETTVLGEEEAMHEESIEIAPLGTSPAASDAEITDGSAAVVSNSSAGTDTILRPAFDGVMTFKAIREASAPEAYSWVVNIGPEQTLKLIDPQHAAIYWDDGTQGFLITAQSAHGADGEAVPTSLSVSEGNVITQTVHHRNSGFVYPVVAGVGWEGGFQTHQVLVEQPQPAPVSGFWESDTLVVGAPEAVPGGSGATASSTGGRKQFLRVRCSHYSVYEPTTRGNSECGNPFTGDIGESVIWNMAIRGAFLYEPGRWVEHRGAIACNQTAYDKSLAWFWYVKPAYECRYGPKTSDGNGGSRSTAGNYLRAQAHWELGHRAKCPPDGDCNGTPNPTIWEDRAMELHLWPSGAVQKVVP